MNEHFSALSLSLRLNWPGDIVITISLLKTWTKSFGEGSSWGYMTDELQNPITLSAMEGWKKR